MCWRSGEEGRGRKISQASIRSWFCLMAVGEPSTIWGVEWGLWLLQWLGFMHFTLCKKPLMAFTSTTLFFDEHHGMESVLLQVWLVFALWFNFEPVFFAYYVPNTGKIQNKEKALFCPYINYHLLIKISIIFLRQWENSTRKVKRCIDIKYLGYWFTRGYTFAPQKIFGNIWKHFGHHSLWDAMASSG